MQPCCAFILTSSWSPINQSTQFVLYVSKCLHELVLYLCNSHCKESGYVKLCMFKILHEKEYLKNIHEKNAPLDSCPWNAIRVHQLWQGHSQNSNSMLVIYRTDWRIWGRKHLISYTDSCPPSSVLISLILAFHTTFIRASANFTQDRPVVYNHWTGLVDWTSGLDWWTGLVDWTGGLDWWTGLVG